MVPSLTSQTAEEKKNQKSLGKLSNLMEYDPGYSFILDF